MSCIHNIIRLTNLSMSCRGVSRWDTCGAQAVLEANGGGLGKLSSFIDTKQFASYNYLKSDTNLDFTPNLSLLTPYNSHLSAAQVKAAPPTLAREVTEVKAYSNLNGLIALSDQAYASQQDAIHAALLRAKSVAALAYD